MKTSAIHYTLRPANPAAHRFTVSCTVRTPDPTGQRFSLPAWIPGSYLIRDFARHLIGIRAEAAGRAVALTKIDKHTWQAAAVKNGAPLTLNYEIYAWDLSVRGAHLDTTHAFFNGSSMFLSVCGQEGSPCRVNIQPPAGPAYARWRVATALEPAKGEAHSARRHGFGLYRAANYDELIDHPVEMGVFTLARFVACGVPHEIALSGRHDCDLERLTGDLKRVCEWQIRLFGEPAPMQRYVFLISVVGDGYGGLEHRASTALICARHDLPYKGMQGVSEGYRTLLGLCSHEYFHTWNVKRIKPAAFIPYDLTRENYTTLLWAFEGFTSYYDDLALLRSGVITRQDWLELTAKTLSNVEKTPGRRQQSLAESSFDAWSKFYRPDENTPNVVVSYYAKGALFALALDLTLRRQSQGRVSLDTLMRTLWQRYGQTGRGLEDESIRQIAEELAGVSLKRFFTEAIDGTGDLPLKKLLAAFGIALTWSAPASPSLGAKTTSEGTELRLSTVFTDGAAERAGLAAGDLLLAIDGLRVTAANLDKQLARRAAGDGLSIHVFRRDELMQFTLRLEPPAADTARLQIENRAHPLRRDWLGDDA